MGQGQGEVRVRIAWAMLCANADVKKVFYLINKAHIRLPCGGGGDKDKGGQERKRERERRRE